MPIQLGKQSRRRFIATAAGWGASVLAGREALASSPESFALISDTHISGNLEQEFYGVCMAENFRQIVSEVRNTGADGVIVSGDCAHLRGDAEDYRAFGRLVRPLIDDGRVGPVNLLMGNHDDRNAFASVLADEIPGGTRPLSGRVAGGAQSVHADWFFLDTLKEGSWTAGELGRAQLAWLARELDADPARPAIVVAHHDPGVCRRPLRHLFGGLKDADDLLEVLRPRSRVKALIHGHIHRWDVTRDKSGMHLVALPPASYVFDGAHPNGWTRAELRAGGMDLRLQALDRRHPEHDRIVRLDWR